MSTRSMTVPSDHPLQVSGEQNYKVLSGGTVYYSNFPNVSSSSNIGSVTSGSTLARRVTSWIISASTSEVMPIPVGPNTLAGGNVGVYNTSAPTAATSTTPASGTQFVTSLRVPYNMPATGAAYLVGGTGGTDRAYAVLYDSSGAVLANSTTASNGTVVGTANQYQSLNFDTPVLLNSGLYFVGISINGTTARIATQGAGSNVGLLAGQVSQTHGSIAAITPPSSFTADKGPFVFLY